MRMMMLLTGLALVGLCDVPLYLLFRKSLKKYRSEIWFGIHSLCFIGLLLLLAFYVPRLGTTEGHRFSGCIAAVLLAGYLPKLLFLCLYLPGRILNCFSVPLSQWLSRFFRGAAVLFSAVFFLILLYDFTWGRNRYKVEEVEVSSPEVPAAFDGFRIVQLTDMHLGSRSPGDVGISRLCDRVDALQPDLIVFTGDMVNNLASEMTPWIETLARLKAPYGKYAVMGNHDYGDYAGLRSEERARNSERFYENMERMGFTMLDNAAVPLIRQNDTLMLCGVENWGEPPFSRYGDLPRALRDCDGLPVLLLSHNPSHWRTEVLEYPVFLTLSGHTHAMQMGIDLPGFRWSPARYRYPEYNGLYEHDGRYLYVSRGAGYIGLNGRIGMRPEITLLRLKRCE